MDQPYLYPANLFDGCNDHSPTWTCVRTRPRWEKRFAQWLLANNFAFFLPVAHKRVHSHRKTRISELPLFPGYVFVEGLHQKEAFARSGCVVYILHPRSPEESRDVHLSLSNVCRMLLDGREVLPLQQFSPGEEIVVVSGSLAGIRGRFLRKGSGGKLQVWLDLLGAGVAAELDDASQVEPVT